jgi:DnaK suppressor protein
MLYAHNKFLKFKLSEDKKMNKKDLSLLRKMLIARKAEFLKKINGAHKDIDMTAEDIGDEMDIAVKNAEKEISFELAANDRIAMEEINEALGKMEKNSYGKCECCGKDIVIERLKAIPWGRYCFECQEEAERPPK